MGTSIQSEVVPHNYQRISHFQGRETITIASYKAFLGVMVQSGQAVRDVEEPLIIDHQQDADGVSYTDIAREFSIMGWIGFGGQCSVVEAQPHTGGFIFLECRRSCCAHRPLPAGEEASGPVNRVPT